MISYRLNSSTLSGEAEAKTQTAKGLADWRAKKQEPQMPLEKWELYSSPNGDRWSLVRDPEAVEAMVARVVQT